MKQQKLGFLIVLFIATALLRGQAISNGNGLLPMIFSASPNASSLGAYGQVPVNLFNGLPNINVNLYNIKVDNFEMPISMSYNLSSIKPEERPSWTGLGWNLNAGGAITHLVKGRPDETIVSNMTDPSVFSYYDHYNELNTLDWYSNTKLNGYANWLGAIAPTKFAAMPAPDEFMFNVNGLSGSFFKNHEGIWVVKANQNIDIKINEELKKDFKIYEVGNHIANNRTFNISRIFYGFTLTTDDGTQYVFGKDPNALEFSAPANVNADGKSPNFVVKTWYITKIILPNSKTIAFQYKTNETSSPLGDTTNSAVFKQYSSDDVLKYWTYSSDNRVTLSEGSSSGRMVNKILERMYVVYLDKIITNDTEISFNSSLSNDLDYDLLESAWGQYTPEYNKPLSPGYRAKKHWYKLDNVIVKSILGSKQLYKAAFKYLENPSSRLFLTGIDESGIINSAINKNYTFEYNQTSLPPYTSAKIDNWGFFNNTTFYGIVAPPAGSLYYTYDQLKKFYPLSREPNASYLQAGTLTKIIYPTKGFTQFYYEPNDFSKVVDKNNTGFGLINAKSNNEIGGGLRIKKIVSDPLNNGNKLIKEYFYVKDFKNNNLISSGILSGRPLYIEEVSDPNMQYFRLSSNTFGQLNDTNGSPVTYTNVVEKLQDGSFTEYLYSNHDNGFTDKLADQSLYRYTDANGNVFAYPTDSDKNILTKKLSFNSLESERGNLLSEKKFNAQKTIVEETNFIYNDDINRFNDKIRSLDFSETVIGSLKGESSGLYGPAFEHMKSIVKLSAYTIYSHKLYLKKKEHISYNLTNNSSVKTITDYVYSNLPNHHHLKNEIVKNSRGETLETKYYYAQDTEMANKPFMSDLKAANMVGIPLNTQISNTGTKLSEQLTVYEKSTSTSNLVLPKAIYAAKFPNIFPIVLTDKNLEKKVTYDQYDDKGNILQYTLENGTAVSVIWGYNKTQPIAKVENATYSQVNSYVANFQNLSNTGTEANLIVALNTLKTSLPNAMITTYTYIPLIGISTITDPKGDMITYTYDSFGRLEFVKDKDGKLISENQYHYKN